MKRHAQILATLSIALLASCSHKSSPAAQLKPTAFGSAVVESSGGKQSAQTGAPLPQPLVVQVNDAQGTAVAGALVEFSAAPGVIFDPASDALRIAAEIATDDLNDRGATSVHIRIGADDLVVSSAGPSV